MRVTKVGHSCLFVEEGSLKLLVDPGNYNPTPLVEGVDVVLITHEHDDHCYLPAIQDVLKQNPNAEIIRDPRASSGGAVDAHRREH